MLLSQAVSGRRSARRTGDDVCLRPPSSSTRLLLSPDGLGSDHDSCCLLVRVRGRRNFVQAPPPRGTSPMLGAGRDTWLSGSISPSGWLGRSIIATSFLLWVLGLLALRVGRHSFARDRGELSLEELFPRDVA